MERRFSYAIVLGSLLSLLGATTPLDLELLTDAADLGGPAGSTGGASWVMVLPAGQGGPGGSDPSEHDPTVVPPFEFDPNCPYTINERRIPWHVIEHSAQVDPSRGGTRVLLAVIGSGLWRNAVGLAYAVAREPNGEVSLYRFHGTGSTLEFQEALRSVSELYMRPESGWERVVASSSVLDLGAWIEAGEGRLSSEAQAVFRGAHGGLLKYISYPDVEDQDD
ncbi:MAG: hypothetical protein IPM13_15615 [Phycisphaerales bacterium]|nr:hypothetical protein [Phycisphaerales bacterium]